LYKNFSPEMRFVRSADLDPVRLDDEEVPQEGKGAPAAAVEEVVEDRASFQEGWESEIHE
jgi:hypothetical protein